MYLFKIIGINDESRKEMKKTEGVKKMEPLTWPTKKPRRSNVLPERTLSSERTLVAEHPVSLHLHHNAHVPPVSAAGKFVPPVPWR